MMFLKLCLLICCVLGGRALGMMVGGFEPISLSQVTELPYYRNVESSIRKSLLGEGNPKLSSQPIKLECASRQLVNGLNWKVYFSVGEDYQCKVRWYISFYSNEPNDFHVKCSEDKDANFCAGHRRSRRSLTEENSYPTLLSMEKKGDKKLLGLFEVFNFHYNRTYSASDSELYQKKYETFAQNWEVIKHLNSIERGSAVYGMTKFMDYTSDEFKRHFAPGLKASLVQTPKLADTSVLEAEKMPDSVDWRKKGAVTPVKNQGECGSCWAFSTTGNVEGQWFVKTGKLLSLSEQELVDCDALDDGCEGGLPSNAYKSIMKLGGLESESDYPYDGRDEKCNINKTKLGVYVNDSISLPTDEVKIAKWIAKHGPVSIGINANLMQFYFGGISHPWKIFCNPKSLDHGVLIVGYGTEDDKPYWIIKNSWGPDWGEEGYYRIYRGDGSCGVNQMVTSAVIN